jgi:hypothetical protein
MQDSTVDQTAPLSLRNTIRQFRQFKQESLPKRGQFVPVFPIRHRKNTAIGLDLQANQFCAVRVKIEGSQVELTHQIETPDFAALGKELEKADRVITRPPPNTWYNRRQARVDGDWGHSNQPSRDQRGREVFRVAQRWTPIKMDQTLFGWRVLSSNSQTSEIEIHQSERSNCNEYRATLETLKLGPVYFDAWHTTALSCAIPSRFDSFILQTRSPDGYALVKKGALIGHLADSLFRSPYDPEHPDKEKFLSFLDEHHASTGQLQAYFLDRKQTAPQIPGLSCSWIGENCRELVGTELSIGCLQALGLALSNREEWWLHHIDEFRPGPGPMQKLREAIDGFRR